MVAHRARQSLDLFRYYVNPERLGTLWPTLIVVALLTCLIVSLVLLDAKAEAIIGVVSGWLLATIGQLVISPRIEAAKRRQERREAALRELVMDRIPRAEQSLRELEVFWIWLAGKDSTTRLQKTLPSEMFLSVASSLRDSTDLRKVAVPWPFILEVKGWRLLLTEIGHGETLRFYARLYANAHAIEAFIYNLGIYPSTKYVEYQGNRSSESNSASEVEGKRTIAEALRGHIEAAEDALPRVEKAAYDALGLSSWEELSSG
jgi:hypothetical protein